ncbi:MAG: hypothetical protein PSV35_04970 [bacterium]|nr:hypothetical protein [bacterium]
MGEIKVSVFGLAKEEGGKDCPTNRASCRFEKKIEKMQGMFC